jgi:hypothetical protein
MENIKLNNNFLILFDKKNENFIFLYFFYIKETFQLIIPMKKEIFSNHLSQEEILNNKLYILIKIGNPSQKIKAYINSETHIIFISENKTLQGTYNKNLSKTYS